MSITPQCGEIIFVMAPSVGYRKYHICLGANEHGTFLFLFLNSDNGYANDCIFPCSDFPSLAPSSTRQSVVSFSMLPRFTTAQLDLHNAQSFGMIGKPVAQALRTHLESVKSLPRPDKKFAMAALDSRPDKKFAMAALDSII
ncbi:MAG: hypothetical protein M3Q52_09570 [Pseudomonadota bacterium]|nr:hypothetical protein [Pseudomonadota bacterium]